VPEGHDIDHHAADALALVEHLDLRNAVHIGHFTDGCCRALRRAPRQGQAKAVLMSAVTPINPENGQQSRRIAH